MRAGQEANEPDPWIVTSDGDQRYCGLGRWDARGFLGPGEAFPSLGPLSRGKRGLAWSLADRSIGIDGRGFLNTEEMNFEDLHSDGMALLPFNSRPDGKGLILPDSSLF